MRNSSLNRGIRAAALVFLAFTAALSSAGCGKDGGGGPTDPAPSDPGPIRPGSLRSSAGLMAWPSSGWARDVCR